MLFTEGAYISGMKGRDPLFGVQSKQLGQQVQRVRVGDLLALQVLLESVLLVAAVKHVEAAPDKALHQAFAKGQILVDSRAAKPGLDNFISMASVLRPTHTECSKDMRLPAACSKGRQVGPCIFEELSLRSALSATLPISCGTSW